MDIKRQPGKECIWDITLNGVSMGFIRKRTKYIKRWMRTVPVEEYDLIYHFNKYKAPRDVYGLKSFKQAKSKLMQHKLKGYFT